MADGAKGTCQTLSGDGFAGGCQCGAARYKIAANSLIAYTCHCKECQKQSASAFGISVPVLKTSLSVQGALSVWTRPTDSGSTTDCYFCPQCGSRLYHAGANRPGMVTIKGGSLDNAADLEPIAHIWVKSAPDWLELPRDKPHWETQPQSQEEWMVMLGLASG